MEWFGIGLNFRWPHEGIMIGYEYIAPDEEDNYHSIRIHLTLVTLLFDFG